MWSSQHIHVCSTRLKRVKIDIVFYLYVVSGIACKKNDVCVGGGGEAVALGAKIIES